MEREDKKIESSWKDVREGGNLEEEYVPKLHKQKKKPRKITITICIVAFAVLVGGLGFIELYKPYAITVDGKDVAIVASKSQGAKVVKEIMRDYKPEESEVKKVVLDKELEVEKQMPWDEYDLGDAISTDRAVRIIEKKNQKKDPLFTATIVGETKTEEDYIPEIDYKKDEEMYAGEARVEIEGQPGRQIVTRRITTLNGKVEKTIVVNNNILEEGKAAIVYKGLLGLPEGEDWKTYEGDPVFAGADDLITIGKKYIGTPYKYGGYDINKAVDCVQYVRSIYRLYGINLPDGHKGLRRSGYGVSYSNMQKGDVICYTGHVAIYLGGGKIIHSSSSGGVHISNTYHGQKIVTVRRIID